MAVRIANIEVKSTVGTLVLSGPDGDFDSTAQQIWVKLEGSHESNGGPQQEVNYKITFTGNGSPQSLIFRGRFAGVGYEFRGS